MSEWIIVYTDVIGGPENRWRPQPTKMAAITLGESTRTMLNRSNMNVET
jgi:hypothetical protein